MSGSLWLSKGSENTEAECVEDIFRACVWVASAPLHEAGQTTKSGTMLKAEISRGQLAFVSDNPPADFNI